MQKISNEHLFAVRLMEHLVVPTFVLDPEGRVLIWNKACERLTCIKAEEVLGTTDHWKAFYEERRMCLADFVLNDKMDEVGKLYSNFTVRDDVFDGVRAETWVMMSRANQRRYLAINCGPIYDDDGNMIAIVETLRDMTDQKIAELTLENMVHKDGLTELANRRYFDTRLQSYLRQASKQQEMLSLILCDIDHFKAYNDTYGHQKGDTCLKSVAQALGAQAFRSSDVVARYGGEEFAYIMPTSSPEGAQKVGERICQAVYDLNLPHESSKTADRVTISVGVVSLIPDEDMLPETMIEMADEALYSAKKKGRNRFEIYTKHLELKTG